MPYFKMSQDLNTLCWPSSYLSPELVFRTRSEKGKARQDPRCQGIMSGWPRACPMGKISNRRQYCMSQTSKCMLHFPIILHMQTTNSKIHLLRISRQRLQSIKPQVQGPAEHYLSSLGFPNLLTRPTNQNSDPKEENSWIRYCISI